MRIVAGTARGRPLARPPSGVRPTSDRVREALFDILGSVEGLRVLDLFAGTGALGLEALSRGAAQAVFVDDDARAARSIRENAARLGFSDAARVIRLRFDRALATLARDGERFDLALVDPPYGRGLGEEALAALAAAQGGRAGLLAPGATVVVETATRDEPPAVTGLARVSSRRYGDTTLHFFRPEA